MDETFPFALRSYYPHMKPADVAIWEKFITEFPDVYDHVQYDVKVGSLPPFDPTVNDLTGGSVEALYRRKIDVVGFKLGQIDIIEIKPNAGTSALGQVLGYKELYKQDFSPPVEPKAIVITDFLGPDMAQLAAKMGVLLVVV